MLEAYLQRIAYQGPVEATRACLIGLHRAHLRAIPYENLDVQLGHAVGLSPAAAFDKIVTARRGGWCYEMNGLFGAVLREIGFQVTRCSAAVMRKTRGDVMIANHLVLKVMLAEGAYLADVGFGDGPHDPFPVQEGRFVSQGFGFGLAELEGGWWRFQRLDGGEFSGFDFTLAPADESLLEKQCRFLQSAEESPFVQNAVVQRHAEDGIWQMRGRVLRKTTPLGANDFLIASAGEYVLALKERFGIDLPQAGALWAKICARHNAIRETA